MQAIILAAGMGKRLKDLTAENTKCMVEVNGKTLIDRALHQLEDLSLDRIIIVTGYEGQKLREHIQEMHLNTPIVFVDNPVYDSTNNIYSLYLAKDFLAEDDTLLLESDLIFEDGVLNELLDDPRPTLALVDKYESWMDGTVVTIDGDDRIIDFIPGKRFKFEDIASYYKTVNIYKFSRDFSQTHYIPFLEAYSKALGNNEYYEQVLRVITLLDDSEMKAKRLEGQAWYEIDDLQDLDIARSIFSTYDEKDSEAILSRYGGYWRYPNLIDFCYLVNPFYPPQRLVDEMQASFEKLLRQYPSGMRVNALLAAKTFGVKEDYIAVGNGAAELIRELPFDELGRFGIVRPTFEEYPNRIAADMCISFWPHDADLRYSASDLIAFFGDKNIDTLVLINPDNPSGNYIARNECLGLIEWCASEGIRIIVDESFIDFSDEADSSLLENGILESNPHLTVVKSISKSYGVPGLRLGILASSDREFVKRLKNSLSIWNINSFGEFYLQIAEKYGQDYRESLDLMRSAREGLMEGLSGVRGCEPLPSQANYIMVRLADGVDSKALIATLLNEYSILVKDLSQKIPRDRGIFLRVAVRTPAENGILVDALRAVLGEGE